MKPHYYIVPREANKPYISRHHSLPNFGTVWHYHPELELHYIIKGQGVRFIGDNVDNFDDGELLLIGADLPHMWRCNDKYFKQNPELEAEAVVVQFLPDFMGRDFLEKSESEPVSRLYNIAKSGLEIHGKTKELIIPMMYESVKEDGLSRMLRIFTMLEILSKSKDLTPISSAINYRGDEEEKDRINKICTYALNNYKHKISLEDIAQVANLSSTSFCRYFKLQTKKTFRNFLNEIRISHAKRLLIEDRDLTTESICFECGFNNRSNFFRQFKSITGITPIEYRQQYASENILLGVDATI